MNGLLSCNNEDLEGDRALSLLQERLQIKPLDLDKLCLPHFEHIPKIGLKSTRESLPKPTRVLSNIDNMLKRTSIKTPVKLRLGTESSVEYVASPTPPKSPFASVSLLNKRIFQTNSSRDPFSQNDMDQLPMTNSSPIEHITEQFGSADVSNPSVKWKPPQNEQDGNTRSLEVAITDFHHASEKCVNKDSGKVAAVVNVGSTTLPVTVDDKVADCNMEDIVMNGNLGGSVAEVDKVADCNMEDIVMNKNLGGSVADEDAQANRATTKDNEVNLDTLLKGISTQIPVKCGQLTESPIKYLDSPNWPKRPLASFSMSSKQTTPSSGPTTRDDLDQLPVTNPSQIQLISKQFSAVDVKESDKTKSPLYEQDDANRIPEITFRNSSHTSDKSVNEDSSETGAVLDMVSSASHVAMEDKITGCNMENMFMSENFVESSAPDENVQANIATVEDEVFDIWVFQICSYPYRIVNGGILKLYLL